MKRSTDFEIVDIADEYMAVPVGGASVSFHGIVALNEAAAFLLHQLDTPKSIEELVSILTNEFEVDTHTAISDITNMIGTLKQIGVIIDD